MLLHGRGLSPNEPNIIGPLRLAISESNINVFSLQLPVLSKGKTYNDYVGIFKYSDKRIESALRYIEKETNVLTKQRDNLQSAIDSLSNIQDYPPDWNVIYDSDINVALVADVLRLFYANQ